MGAGTKGADKDEVEEVSTVLGKKLQKMNIVEICGAGSIQIWGKVTPLVPYSRVCLRVHVPELNAVAFPFMVDQTFIRSTAGKS